MKAKNATNLIVTFFELFLCIEISLVVASRYKDNKKSPVAIRACNAINPNVMTK